MISILYLSQITAFAAVQPPSLTAQGAVLMDLNSGEILYQKNENVKFAPASTTKIMTALLTLEKLKLTDKVIVGKNPPYEDGSKIYLLEGEELTVEQLLYAMLLSSANDAALALAEHISGSKEAFAKLMNQRAKELGCKNTNFVNPNGLYKTNHLTSAYDLALIAEKAMENPEFRKIVSTVSYNISPTNKQPQTRYLYNHNKLLSNSKYKNIGADGVKTGYTVKSRHTYVGSATRNGRTLLVVFLMDEKGYYDETVRLLNYGFNNFECQKIISKDSAITDIKIKGSDTSIPVYPKQDFYLSTPKGTPANVVKKIILNNDFSKITKNETVGYVYLTYDNNKKMSIPILSGSSFDSSLYKLESKGNGSYKKVFRFNFFYYALFAAFGLFLLRGFYRKYKRLSRLKR